MNKFQIFNSAEFGEIRTIIEDGKILFCGSDAAKALGYKKPANAVTDHCRYTLKRSIPHPQNPDKQLEMLFISEGDLYRLIAKSELPGADRFESWIFDEVLPTIRQTGQYFIFPQDTNVEQRMLTTDDYLRASSIIANCRNERLPYVLAFLEQGGFSVPCTDQTESMEDRFAVATAINHAVNDLGYKIKEISRLTGIERTQICKYHFGRHVPQKSRADYIISVLQGLPAKNQSS